MNSETAGILFYVITCTLLSRNPEKINWRPVLWGFALQFIIALLVLRTEWGYTAVDYAGNQIALFLGFAKEGEFRINFSSKGFCKWF